MSELRRGVSLRSALLVTVVVLTMAPAQAWAKAKFVLLVPFDASSLPADQRWMGEGAAQILSLAFAQHPTVVQVDRGRLRSLTQPDPWREADVIQAARSLSVDAALYGSVERAGSDRVLRPRLFEVKTGASEGLAMEPIVLTEDELLPRLAELPMAYARTLKIPMSDIERDHMEKAARPTRSLRALELFARGQMAARRGGQEGNEGAADLLARAIEADPGFVVAQYTLGLVHQALGNRWKAAAQFRAATQLDPTFPESYKALGDLFLAAPRRLFDQAVEAYGKAIELRPFYARPRGALPDARAAKGEIDAAIASYQKALAFNPANPRVHMSLGKIYYGEKGLYYEAVSAYKKAIELDPSSVEARMGLGEVYEDKGLYNEAIGEYRRVIEADSKHTGAMYNLAIVYEKVDPKEAVAQWERYITIASQIPSEKDWVDVARQHLRKLKNQLRE